MKLIKDLNIAVKNTNFYTQQFSNVGEKNILFIGTQLTGKHLYKMLLPLLGMYNAPNTITALSGLSKHNPLEQLTDIRITITAKQIMWADFIVIPFTTQALAKSSSENKNLYEIIKTINTQCKIIYWVDFNFYELSNNHPYKKIITEQKIINIEDNIWFSDICMVSNNELMKYLLTKMNKLSNNRMTGIKPNASIACMPFYIDKQILLENVDYDPLQPKKIDYQNNYDKITKTAESERKNKTKDKKVTVFFENNKWSVNQLQSGKVKKTINTYKTKVLAVKEAIKWSRKGFDVLIYGKDGMLKKSIIKAKNKNGK